MLGGEESSCVCHYLSQLEYLLGGRSAVPSQVDQLLDLTSTCEQQRLLEVFSLIKALFYSNYSNNSNIQDGIKPSDNAVSIGAFRKSTSFMKKEKLLNNPFRNSYNALWVLYENILELTVN